MRRVLKGAKYFTQEGVREGDIAIEGGIITQIGYDIATPNDEVVELAGTTIFPGFVDLHVHLREPGFGRKERVATGTAAAARGGVTSLVTMPNLSPAPDSVENLKAQTDILMSDSVVKAMPLASITRGQRGAGELVDFEALAPYVVGFSDDGVGVQSEELMRQAMVQAAKVDRPIVAHCEDNTLLFKGYIHDGEYARLKGHRGICSESEWGQVKRDIALVGETECQYHVCHISTKETVALIRAAKCAGAKRISCETAPHYLLLTDMDIKEEGRFKMNPPLRSEEDRQALLAGLRDGTIDAIATDHAPHMEGEKSRGLEKSAFGIVGIESAFALLYTYLVCEDIISLRRLVELMSSKPRELFELEECEIEVGSVADLVAIDLDEEYTIDSAEFLSMGKATPFEGWRVKGRTKLTLVEGEVAYRE